MKDPKVDDRVKINSPVNDNISHRMLVGKTGIIRAIKDAKANNDTICTVELDDRTRFNRKLDLPSGWLDKINEKHI